MSKFCKELGRKVTYLFCQECDEKLCKEPRVTILPKKSEDVSTKKSVSETIQEPQRDDEKNVGPYPSCETCFHKVGTREITIFQKKTSCVFCEIHNNQLIDSIAVSHKGCEFYNIDMSNEKICLNCEHFLGGGDWGLACDKHYHILSQPLTEACQDFNKRKEEK